MKFKLLITAFALALPVVIPAHAAVFKSSALPPGQTEGNILVFFIPGKPQRLINPGTGETRTLPAKNGLGAKDGNSSPANQ